MYIYYEDHTICHRYIDACHNCSGVSHERMKSARLTQTNFGFPDPFIPLIVSRVTGAFTVPYT